MSEKKYMLVDVPIIEGKSPEGKVAKTDSLFLYRTRSGKAPIYAALSPYLLIVVLRDGLTLNAIQGSIVDVSLGWHPSRREAWDDDKHLSSILPGNSGRRHSKLTVRSVANHKATLKLSDVLKKAPTVNPPIQRTIYLSPLQLEKWEKLGKGRWLYRFLDNLNDGDLEKLSLVD